MTSNTNLIILIFFFQINYGQVSKKIDEIFINFNEKPGVSIVINKNNETIYNKNFGLSNLDYDLKINKNTVFDITSTSFQFTAACIILLEIEGKLNLEDSIQKYIPDFPIYAKGEIKIKHLLHQTSGIRDYLRLIHAKGTAWDININNEKALKLLRNQKEINFIPGSRHAYNNSDYMLLAIIIEKISNMSFAKFAKKNIFEPLNMTATFINDHPNSIIKNRAIGYQNEANKFKRSHYYNVVVVGDGNLYTTTNDLLKWSNNFKNSKIGGGNFINKMLTLGKLNNGKSTIYASGLYRHNYNGFPSLLHSGHWAGFRSIFYKIPSLDYTVILLSNNTNTFVWSLLDQINAIVLKNEIIKNRVQNHNTQNREIVTKNYQLPTKQLHKFKGFYFNYLEGNSKEILIKNDTLIYRRSSGIETKLIPIKKNKFTFLNARFVVLDFEKNNTQMRFTINNNESFIYKKYQPKKYTPKELKKFTGNFYSKELNVQYNIKSNEHHLCITINSNNFVCLKPEAKNIFKDIEEHFGYLKFKTDKNNSVISFTINDELAKNIEFKKMNIKTI